MKNKSLPVKRNPVRKSSGIFRRISAVTNRQRAATATAEDLEMEESGSNVSRALTIIFLIHIVAIGLIFFHQRFLADHTPALETAAKQESQIAPAKPATPRNDLPRLAPGEKPYIVKTGDNYARIAAAQDVNEDDLRKINNNVDIVPNLILRIPPKRIVAEVPPEVAALRAAEPSHQNRGLVEAIDVTHAPKAVLVRPGAPSQPANADTGRKTYVIKPGDNLWRIAGKYGTTPEKLKKANDITDASKIRPGMKLVIP
ncbi:MAG: LysM peptidoglycan-binding domain-containing protein [Verrucomicrobiota bacterium]